MNLSRDTLQSALRIPLRHGGGNGDQYIVREGRGFLSRRTAALSLCAALLLPALLATAADEDIRNSSIPVVGDVLDEALVDLQLGNRKTAEQRQGRVAGAEVVHGDADAEPVDVIQQLRDPPGVAHRRRFGELDREHRCIDSDDAAIVRGTIAPARGLGMTVLTEGVGTPSQLHFLARYGGNVAQGLLSSPPVPADEVRGWLAAPGTTLRHAAH